MNYTVKSALIICAVGLVSFFVAELVIPEKDAVTRTDPAPAITPDAEQVDDGPDNGPDSDGIPVVVAGNTPAAAPIIPPAMKTAPAPETKTLPPAAKTVPPVPEAAPPATKTVSPFAPPDPRKTAAGVSVENSAVCASVVEKVPVGVSNRFSTKETKQVYFFTLITGARDTTAIVHRWYHNGKLIQTSPLSVRSAHWRTHSRRNLYSPNAPDPVGDWRVEAVEGKTGQVMGSASFTVSD